MPEEILDPSICPADSVQNELQQPKQLYPEKGWNYFNCPEHPRSYLSHYWLIFLAFQWVCATVSGLLSWLAPVLPGSSYTRPERGTDAGYETGNCYETDNCY